ncbi:hypothetical protein L208DRAFT_1195530, partial [Tricholoma matsutake]
HKARYPKYRFHPVHNKEKCAQKRERQVGGIKGRMSEEVVVLLLESKKGNELAAAICDLD